MSRRGKRRRDDCEPVDDFTGVPDEIRPVLCDANEMIRKAMASHNPESMEEDLKKLGDMRHSTTHSMKRDGCSKQTIQFVTHMFDTAHNAIFFKMTYSKCSALASNFSSVYSGLLNGTCASESDGVTPMIQRHMTPGRFGAIKEGNDKFVDLVMYIQYRVRADDLRRLKGNVYRRLLTKQGTATIAWKKISSIHEYIYSICRQDINPNMWTNVVQMGAPVTAAAKYFDDSSDPVFPEIVRDRAMFSFENGVYLADSNEFHTYPIDPGSTVLHGNRSPAKHFDVDFPVDDWVATRTSPEAWKEIDTPAVHGIFAYQSIPEDAIDMMYVSVGRILHDVGAHDSWGIVGWIVGVAGTGKTTFCNNLLKIWDDDDVGVLSNNCEQQFGLYPLMDKFFFVAPEIRSDCRLGQAEWQGIATGDKMSFSIKYQAAKSGKWTASSFWAGNEFPSHRDNGGSVGRRRMIFSFNKKIDTENGSLGEDLERELPKMILKSAVAYLGALADPERGSASVWKWLPRYFWDQRKIVTASNSPLESFIQNKIVKQDGAFIIFNEFKDSVKEHARENNFKDYKLESDHYESVLADHGLRVVGKHPCTSMGRVAARKCVVGGRLKTHLDDEDGAGVAA